MRSKRRNAGPPGLAKARTRILESSVSLNRAYRGSRRRPRRSERQPRPRSHFERVRRSLRLELQCAPFSHMRLGEESFQPWFFPRWPIKGIYELLPLFLIENKL